jgi:hypothetical protein
MALLHGICETRSPRRPQPSRPQPVDKMPLWDIPTTDMVRIEGMEGVT